MNLKQFVSAEEALRSVRSGARVFVGSGCAQPAALVSALVDAAPRLSDVEVIHLLTLGSANYTDPKYSQSFRHNALFIGGNVREAVREGRADYTPIFLSEVPALFQTGHRRVDVALISVSKPDRHGYVSMGIHVDIQRAAVDSAPVVIAEVNPNMPRTFGASTIHLSQIDALVEGDTPLLELQGAAELDEVSMRIGRHVARLIDHGSCLQLGIGKIPDAVLCFLTDKRELGVHTEMFSDGLLPLLQQGNISNRRKKLHPGRTVTSFAMGTKALYDYVDDNPSVLFFASDLVNDPRLICQNDQVVAVNSALQVDLTGQVCADSLGYRFFSGIGGQVDFIRGAAMSRGGKPIIALPSTAKGGSVSRIVPKLDEGAGVVTSRGDVHYVVTEFGVAYLHGKTIRERALALIQIAHPDARGELLSFVKKKHYVYEDEQIWQQASAPYPDQLEHTITLGSQELDVRPLKATDERALQEFFYSHQPQTIYNRYFSVKKALGHSEAAELCCVDYRGRMALGAFMRPTGQLIAVGRYYADPRKNLAETALVVHEAFRRRGLATHLTKKLQERAKEVGLVGFFSYVLPSNHVTLALHRSMGHEVQYLSEDNLYRVSYGFEQTEPAEAPSKEN